jgi:hypothetical protein
MSITQLCTIVTMAICLAPFYLLAEIPLTIQENINDVYLSSKFNALKQLIEDGLSEDQVGALTYFLKRRKALLLTTRQDLAPIHQYYTFILPTIPLTAWALWKTSQLSTQEVITGYNRVFHCMNKTKILKLGSFIFLLYVELNTVLRVVLDLEGVGITHIDALLELLKEKYNLSSNSLQDTIS